MGTYNLSPKEIKDSFKEWLKEQEGEVHAHVLAEVWNELADENYWQDHLNTYDKPEVRDNLDYALIHKHCINCKKQKVFQCAIKRGFYKGTFALMKEKWICSDCSSDGDEHIGKEGVLMMFISDKK